MAIVLIVVILAFFLLLVFGLKIIKAKSKKFIFYGGLILVAFVSILLSDMTYNLSDTQKLIGFPIPFVIFRMENNALVDYISASKSSIRTCNILLLINFYQLFLIIYHLGFCSVQGLPAHQDVDSQKRKDSEGTP